MGFLRDTARTLVRVGGTLVHPRVNPRLGVYQ